MSMPVWRKRNCKPSVCEQNMGMTAQRRVDGWRWTVNNFPTDIHQLNHQDDTYLDAQKCHWCLSCQMFVWLDFVWSNFCVVKLCLVKCLCGQMSKLLNVCLVKFWTVKYVFGQMFVWSYVCWVKCFSGQISYGLIFMWSICLVKSCTVKCFSGQIGSKKPATNLVSVWLASF